MNGEIHEVRFEIPVLLGMDSHGAMPLSVLPLAAPNAVTVELDRCFPDVAEGFFAEEPVSAVGREDDEKPIVAKILDVSDSGPLAAGTLPFGHVDAIAVNQFGIHRRRVLR